MTRIEKTIRALSDLREFYKKLQKAKKPGNGGGAKAPGALKRRGDAKG